MHAGSRLDGDPRIVDIWWAPAFVCQMISKNSKCDQKKANGWRTRHLVSIFSQCLTTFWTWQVSFSHSVRWLFARKTDIRTYLVFRCFSMLLCLTSCWSRFAGIISWFKKNTNLLTACLEKWNTKQIPKGSSVTWQNPEFRSIFWMWNHKTKSTRNQWKHQCIFCKATPE